jgi:hypothetical protein
MQKPGAWISDAFLRAAGLVALPAGVLAFGCTSPDAPSSPESARGHRLYLTCSGSCHSPEPVRKFPRHEWEKILPEMIEEARLDGPEAEVLRAYVFSHF